MKAKAIILLTALGVLMVSFCLAEAVSGTCGTGVTWTYSDGTLTISGEGEMANYTKNKAPWSDRQKTIQTVIVNQGVTAIGNYAFFNCVALSNISLPDGLKQIGASALSNCKTLASIEMPDTITSIGSYSFAQCSLLQNIELSKGLRKIGNNAFEGCLSLSKIEMSDSVSSIGYAAFHETGLQQIRLSENLGVMEKNVFESCPDLETVIWPSSMSLVPENTFSYNWCPNKMTSMVLPNGVTTIGENAFSAATQLKEIYLPLTLSTVKSGAFIYCSMLTDVYYAGTEEERDSIDFTVDNSFLLDATWHYGVLTGECIEGIHHLVNGECKYCHRIFSVEGLEVTKLPENLTVLGAEALRGTGAQAVIVPAGCSEIGSRAFADCPDLQYVLLPEGVVLATDALSGTEAELLYR